jgi:hypothetical protein
MAATAFTVWNIHIVLQHAQVSAQPKPVSLPSFSAYRFTMLLNADDVAATSVVHDDQSTPTLIALPGIAGCILGGRKVQQQAAQTSTILDSNMAASANCSNEMISTGPQISSLLPCQVPEPLAIQATEMSDHHGTETASDPHTSPSSRALADRDDQVTTLNSEASGPSPQQAPGPSSVLPSAPRDVSIIAAIPTLSLLLVATALQESLDSRQSVIL